MVAAALFQSHMKTDNTNRLANPENLYNLYTRFRGNSEKKVKKISRQVAAILIIG